MHIIVYMFCIATGMKCTTIMCFNVSVPAPGQVNVVVSAITVTSISLSWSVASGSVARSEVVWREIDRGTESSSGSLTGTSYTIDQLKSTTIYTVTVRASNVAGTTDSQLITFSTGTHCHTCMPYYVMAIDCCFSTSDVCEGQNDACQAENEAVSSDSTAAAIIGGVVAVVFMIIAALTVIVIVALVLRSCSAKNRYILPCTLCDRCHM